MTEIRVFTRLTAGAVTATLAAAGLVATTAPNAAAGTGDTTYTCTFPVLGAVEVPLSTTVPDLPDTTAGAPIPAGSLDPVFDFDITNIASVLGMVTSPSTAGMVLGVGGQPVPLEGFAFGAPSGLSLPASATSGAFTAPAVPGVYDVTMPETFDVTGLLPGVPAPVPFEAPCVTDAPAVLGELTVAEGETPGVIPTTTEAKPVKKRIKKGRAARIKVATIAGVDPLTQPATGAISILKGARTVGTGELVDGAAVIKTKKFRKRGRYTLIVNYLGDPTIPLMAVSSDKVRIRVVKRRR